MQLVQEGLNDRSAIHLVALIAVSSLPSFMPSTHHGGIPKAGIHHWAVVGVYLDCVEGLYYAQKSFRVVPGGGGRAHRVLVQPRS